ncbi:hypothetical protein [Vibrio neptunius]|uniref:hypothetical protein n=1 Tax=Vibrio neptunius TaxID=170651 RepID=UPI003314C05E
MSVTRQSLTPGTSEYVHSSTEHTQEKWDVFTQQCQQMLLRVIQLNATLPHKISFDVHGDSATLYWYDTSTIGTNQMKLERPSFSDNLIIAVYSWEPVENINQYFLEANMGLDLLEAETKAA